MKVLAINGSPRKNGNTARLLLEVTNVLAGHEIPSETLHLADFPLSGCRACGLCGKRRDALCALTQDSLNDLLSRMVRADGILLGSPVYFSGITPEMAALIHRTGMVARVNGNLFRRKVGAGVVAVRRAGALPAFDSLNHFFLIGQMIVPGSSYWNLGMGRHPLEVEGDSEGMETMRVLGENMAWLLERLHGASPPSTGIAP